MLKIINYHAVDNRLYNVNWLGNRKLESRLSQTLSEKLKIVARKDRTYVDRKLV